MLGLGGGERKLLGRWKRIWVLTSLLDWRVSTTSCEMPIGEDLRVTKSAKLVGRC